VPLEVHQFAALQDNYAFLVRDQASRRVACIDTPDAAAILHELKRLGRELSMILNTHWHSDHTGGNAEVQAATRCVAVGPAEVAARIPLDLQVRPGERVVLGETQFDVLDVGGHTFGHVAYYDAIDDLVFVGDALFTMGCGRLCEGPARQMWGSLQRLAALPDQTAVYAAHEYSAVNARFAISVDGAPATLRRANEIFAARARGEPTVPTTIALEKATNPFPRAPDLAPSTSRLTAEHDAFAALRAAKDIFQGGEDENGRA
jgi:hydroxyacylglutathione hydrolase